MRWGDMRRSENVENRGGTGGGIPMGGGGMRIGLGGVIIALIASVLFGINPLDMLGGGEVVAPPPSAPAPRGEPGRPQAPSPQAPSTNPQREMVAHVLGDTEDVWTALFKQLGRQYEKPTLTIFNGQVRSACGFASAAVGPFYCPGDRKLYLDTAFFDTLARRFGAPGDFAQAYVIAHEVGHHVQNLLGTMAQFDRDAQRADERRRNQLQIRLELQADCYAGVWGYFANKRNLLEAGDLEEGLRAAGAVGDDQIMKRTQGYVVPEAFTHGAAEQRVRWFRKGLASGDPRQCDTFSTSQL